MAFRDISTFCHKPFSEHFPLIFNFSSKNEYVKDMILLPKIPWLPNKETAYKDALKKLPNVDYLNKNISIDDKSIYLYW